MSKVLMSMAIGATLWIAAPTLSAAPAPVQNKVTASELDALMNRLSTLLGQLRTLQNQLAAAEQSAPTPGSLTKILFQQQAKLHKLAIRSLQLRSDQVMNELEAIENRINEIRSMPIPNKLQSSVANAATKLGLSKAQAFNALNTSGHSLLTFPGDPINEIMKTLTTAQKADMKERATKMEDAAKAILNASDEKEKAAKAAMMSQLVAGMVSTTGGAMSFGSGQKAVSGLFHSVKQNQANELKAKTSKMKKRDKAIAEVADGTQSLMKAKKQLEKNPDSKAEAKMTKVDNQLNTKTEAKQYASKAEVEKDLAQSKAQQRQSLTQPPAAPPRARRYCRHH